MPAISVKPDQRVLFVGKTGSGKTYLAEYMASPISRLIAFDPKPSLRGWDGLETVTSVNHSHVRALKRGENRRIRIPNPSNGVSGWIPWLQLVWELGDVTLYIDEINLVVYPRRNPPIEFSRLYQQGREKGIGVWGATQRPVNIPLICVTEAEWIFQFRLGNKADRKLIADYGDDSGRMALPIRDEHGFYTFNQSWREAIYTPRLTKREETKSHKLALVERKVS